jgi:FKBP-type peptidyl-prolyl cis-trans isomerase FklB
MKKFIIIACGLVLAPFFAQGAEEAAASELKTQKEKFSYTIGMNLGRNFTNQEVDVDLDLLLRGIKDTIGGKCLLSETQAMEISRALQEDVRQRMTAKRKAQGEKNKTEGEAYLEKHKSEAGVITTASGLQYKILAEGKGDAPKATDTVVVNYRGTLIDGVEFDSSYKRNQPFTTGLNRVVKGWTEALQLMKPGAKFQIVVPSALGYGEGGAGKIGPNAVLIFEIELLEVKPPTPAAPPTPVKPVTSDIIKVPSAEQMKKGEQIQVIKKEDAEKEEAAKLKPADDKK